LIFLLIFRGFAVAGSIGGVFLLARFALAAGRHYPLAMLMPFSFLMSGLGSLRQGCASQQKLYFPVTRALPGVATARGPGLEHSGERRPVELRARVNVLAGLN
jgi:hypothetical protein